MKEVTVSSTFSTGHGVCGCGGVACPCSRVHFHAVIITDTVEPDFDSSGITRAKIP